jgi:hypothetical protein
MHLDHVRQTISDFLRFRVREFVRSSAAGEVRFFRYARIDPALTEALQRLRTRIGQPMTVSSGYRYPSLNTAVGGVEDSRHLVGQAADINCSGLSAIDLARHALEELGATIGIGLGTNYIHVDVRGNLATWTYEGATMSAAEFRTWANQIVAGTRHVRAKDSNHKSGDAILRYRLYICQILCGGVNKLSYRCTSAGDEHICSINFLHFR